MSIPTILKKIITRKHEEVAERRLKAPVKQLKTRIAQQSNCRGFVAAIEAKVQAGEAAVIAEIKKASPSKGVIRSPFIPVDIAKSYQSAGAACLSILTDIDFFQGADDYLIAARSAVDLPVIRKDFIVDEYQVYESRAIGADCILLIASALDADKLKKLNQLAHDLGMDVLVEIHDQRELTLALTLTNRLIGINNRNLHTFATSLDTTYELLDQIDDSRIIITESGFNHAEQVRTMRARGVNGFLIGETFMRAENPGKALELMFADNEINSAKPLHR